MSSLIQRALSGGELDPVLWARSDITKYQTGLRTLRNAYVRRNGGAQGRPGSTKIQPTKISGNTVRYIPFIYNQTVTYVMEFGDKYIRFYQNGSPVLATPLGVWSNSTTYHFGDVVIFSGNLYLNVFNGNGLGPGSTFIIEKNPALYNQPLSTQSGVTPGSSARYWYQMTNGIYEIPTLWSAADLPLIRFDQTGNDMIFTHPSYPQYRITRGQLNNPNGFGLYHVSPGSYLLQPFTCVNDQSDSNLNAPGGSGVITYGISSVSALTDQAPDLGPPYSAGAGCTTTKTVSTLSSPVVLDWTAVTGAISYTIYYLNPNGVWGFLGSTPSTNFIDNGITPDYLNPWVQDNSSILFSTANNLPTACAFYQQRTVYANTNNNPTKSWGSQTGLYDNFNINVPSLATDSLSFKMAGAQDVVQHLLNLGTLLVFTYGSINSVNGDAAGAISPSAINPHRETVHGAASLRPLIVGENAIYSQSQGSIIRDLGFNFQVDGYRGDDLTVFATHLFDNFTIVDWAYQQTPHSIIWAVRDDGTLLSLTYMREQQLLAWAHHDTEGLYENVCCIPEGNQVSVYVVVNRNGVRFVERLFDQQLKDVRNFIGMDCATTIDGRNTTTGTMAVSGGTDWNETELLTLTLTTSDPEFFSFTSQSATNQDMIFLYDASGNLYRFKITSFTSSTVVQGFVDRTIPANLSTVAWSSATSVISGLDYLDGYEVSVFADGYVVGSPNNAAYPIYTVSGGQLTLDKPYAVIQIGLPFTTDIETLDIDTPGPMDNLGDKFKLVGEVTIYMVNSRSIFVGGVNPDTDPTNVNNDPLYRLTEQKIRNQETYDSPMALQTGKITQNIQPEWDSNGHVFIRNVDPTPVLISAISPEGLYPMRGS